MSPMNPQMIALWYSQGNRLSLVSTQDPATVERAEFDTAMGSAKAGMDKANKERLERTKALAKRRKAGTDGQSRF